MTTPRGRHAPISSAQQPAVGHAEEGGKARSVKHSEASPNPVLACPPAAIDGATPAGADSQNAQRASWYRRMAAGPPWQRLDRRTGRRSG
ncbi:hypothetical protein MRX96_018644 [Rhipicephalus microplus]